MIAVVGGLGAALAWACATLCSSRSSRLLGPPAAVAWVMVIGLLPTLPILALASRGPNLADVGWLLLGGLGNIVGLGLSYRAIQLGYVGVVAPIISADGAVAAAIGLALGETIPAVTAAALGLVTIGIVTTATATPSESADIADSGRPAGIALAAVLSLGAGLYALAHVGTNLPLGWALLPPRAVGAFGVALPLAARSRLPRPGPARLLVIAGALGETGGFVAYTLGARQNIAVASVLSSLLGPISVGMGRVLFHERITRRQLLGVLMILGGLVVLGINST